MWRAWSSSRRLSAPRLARIRVINLGSSPIMPRPQRNQKKLLAQRELTIPRIKPTNGLAQRKTVVDLALEEMRERILRGEYPEGSALRQDALANDLGVSRIP